MPGWATAVTVGFLRIFSQPNYLPFAMDWLTIALLLLFGLAFLVVEIIFIPGTTVVGLVGFGLLAVGLWFSYRDYGSTTGHMLLSVSAVFVGVLVYMGLRPRNLDKVALMQQNHGHVLDVRHADVAPGTVGRTLSALRPAGTALFADDRREVTTRGEFVDADSEVLVIGIEHNRIVVRQIA
ncbi:NfeD family protein [Hymenobacter lapidiphilus]